MASPSGVLLRYSSAANGGNGAWQNLTLGQVQLAPQTASNFGQFPRADGNGLTQWASPTNPGDGRRTSLVECNGRSWDLTNTALLGALFSYGSGAGGVTGSASTGAGTQLPGCTLTTGAASGNNVYYNLTGDDKIFKTGRNLQFDVTVALSATTSTSQLDRLNGYGGFHDCGVRHAAGERVPGLPLRYRSRRFRMAMRGGEHGRHGCEQQRCPIDQPSPPEVHRGRHEQRGSFLY